MIRSSWLAFNHWPCIGKQGKPKLSRPIPLCPPLSSRHFWGIRLLSMKFIEENRSENLQTDKGIINFKDGGLNVIVDSGQLCAPGHLSGNFCILNQSAGSSVTWVPDYVVSALRRDVFPSEKNRKLEAESRCQPAATASVRHPHFTIDHHLYKNTNADWYIEYRVWMGDGVPAAQIYGPVQPFMCVNKGKETSANGYMDGLLFTHPTSWRQGDSTENLAIFGLVSVALCPRGLTQY